ETADFLEDMGMEFYKIASFEMIDLDFLRHVAAKQKPMIVSTGMSTLEEMKEAVEAIYETGNHQLALLKCSSAYPAVSDEMNLKTIQHMKEVFDIPIGLSDHSMGSLGAVTAVALGACIIEKHFCLGREIENPDASFSMTPEEFKQMVEDVRAVERAMGKPTYGMAPSEKNNMVFRRSLFAVKDIKAGEDFTSENIRSIRPGYGMKPKYQQDALTMKAGCDIKRGEPLAFEQVKKGAVLFLTNNNNTADFYRKLCECESLVYRFTNKITLDIIKELEPSYVVSFNYKHIVPADVIAYMKGRIVNLHTSYLPYNKGAAPNFFSFYEDTPKGVTIHEMAAGLDEGDILLQKEVPMKAEEETFVSSYDKLMTAISELFFENWDALKKGEITAIKQTAVGTSHRTAALNAIRETVDFHWEENIAQVLDRIKNDRN
ncbi:MAG: N-acetylneuraminate synthase family protein, partial [Lachnospiraceae bacterium]|nr:N-acetylneuraminate synthase family protein [Lachnospiraceae bacterium]